MEEVESYSTGDIQELLIHFSKNTFRVKDNDFVNDEILQKCIDLVSLDYNHVVISNTTGDLSRSYPAHIIVIEHEKDARNGCSNNSSSATCNNANITTATNAGSGPSNSPEPRPQNTIYENAHDCGRLRDLFHKARIARCRNRFPVPVIYFRGKYVCRSATLASGPEIYGRCGLDYLFADAEPVPAPTQTSPPPIPPTTTGDDEPGEPGQNDQSISISPYDWQLFDKVRHSDIRLLQNFNIGTIIDLMVEKKKVKFGMNITSSEKVDKANRYSDFKIVSLPYPGCEFFKEYRDNNYEANGLLFDWTQSYVDASLGVPEDSTIAQLRIDWNNYKIWDLIKLTQNYMRLLIRYLVEQSTGILVHCISGWDRTPLFVSMLRLSLWADGVIHQSLSAYQILYFTIAYDWMLFGHNLEDRLSKGEDIFFFCFNVLKFLSGDEYSVLRKEKSSKQHSSQQVLRTDSDTQLEGVLFEPEGHISSQESNVSLNSSWSSISSRSQDAVPVFYSTDDTNGNAVQIPFMASCQLAYSSSSSSDVTSTSREGACASESSQSINHCNVQTSLSAGNSDTANTSSHVQCRPVTSSCESLITSSNNGDRDCLNGNGNSAAAQGQATGRLSASPGKTHTSPVAVPARTSIRHRNESTSSLNVGSWQFITGTGSLRGSGCGSNSACSSQTGKPTENVSMFDGGLPVTTDSASTLNEDECFIYSNGAQDPLPVPLRRDRLRTVRELFCHCYCSTIGLKIKDGSEGGFGNFLGNFAEKVGIKSPQ